MFQAEKRKAAIEKAKLQQYYQTDRIKGLHVSKYDIFLWNLCTGCHIKVRKIVCLFTSLNTYIHTDMKKIYMVLKIVTWHFFFF